MARSRTGESVVSRAMRVCQNKGGTPRCAGGSLIQGSLGRVGAAATKSGRSSTAGWAGPGKRDGKAYARYLAYLTDIERSPNTVKAYAHDLKDYWIFLRHRGLDWREVRLEDIGEYVAWLRLPPTGRDGHVAVLPSVQPHVAASTINRKLSAFYAHQMRHGVDVGELLTTWQLPGRRGGWKPFLHHISKNKPQPRRTITVKTPKKLPRIPTVTEMQSIVDSCDRLRDCFLLCLLWESGIFSVECQFVTGQPDQIGGHRDVRAHPVVHARRDDLEGTRAVAHRQCVQLHRSLASCCRDSEAHAETLAIAAGRREMQFGGRDP
jgi:hypothetical protein